MRALMNFDTINNAAVLAGLTDEWSELWQRDTNATPFQSPHWLLPWWRVFGGDGELFVLAGRENGRLDALAPLYILRDEDSGESLGIFIGSGVTDYLDILGTNAAAVVDAMTRDGVCQMWDLQQLRSGSPLMRVEAPSGWMASDSEQEPCLILSIENAGDELQNILSTHARKKLRYYRRSLEREATVTFEQPASDTLDTFVDALFELHAARWQQKNMPGMLADEFIQKFHRDVARSMFDAGALRMYALRRNGTIIAIFYGFAHHGTVHYYLSGYDPAFEKYSIGGVIVAHALEQSVREGAHTFDFLRGAEDYKSSWGAEARMNMRRQLIRGD